MKAFIQSFADKKKFPQKLVGQIIILIILAVVCNIIDMAIAFSKDKTNYFAVVLDVICIIYLCITAYIIYRNVSKELSQFYILAFLLFTAVVVIISFVLAIKGSLLSYILALIYGGLCAAMAVVVFVYPKNLAKLNGQIVTKANEDFKVENKPEIKADVKDSKIEIVSTKKTEPKIEKNEPEIDKQVVTTINERAQEVKAQIKTEGGEENFKILLNDENNE